jgi:hypothetical protein
VERIVARSRQSRAHSREGRRAVRLGEIVIRVSGDGDGDADESGFAASLANYCLGVVVNGKVGVKRVVVVVVVEEVVREV